MAKSRKPAKTPKKTRKTPKKSRGCTRQYTKKYSTRGSPPYPANECCGKIARGNDGQTYISRRVSNGICRWFKY